MNILVLAPQPFFQHRGTPIAVRELVTSLAGQGHQVDLLVYHEGQDVPLSTCRLVRSPRIAGLNGIRPGFSWKKIVCDFLMCFKAASLLSRRSYDVVHAVEEAVFMALVFKGVFRVPYVYDMDSSLVQQLADKYRPARLAKPLLRWMERLAVRRSVGVVAVCRSLEELARSYQADKKIARLEDKSLLGDTASMEASPEQLDFGGPIMMYVGNLEPHQGIYLLLRTHARVIAQQPDCHLVVIGGIPAHIRHYTRLAGRLGVQSRTHFLGPRPTAHLGHFLSQAHFVVSPRTMGENTPMKIYSYLDSGRPVLATRLPTHTQVMDDRVAMLADPTPEGMASGALALLEDPDLCRRLADRARQHVAENYSREAYERKLGGFYCELEGELPGTAAVDRNRLGRARLPTR